MTDLSPLNDRLQSKSTVDSVLLPGQQHQDILNKRGLDLRVNKVYLCMFIFILNIPGFSLGYATCYSDQVEYIFDAKFGNDNTEKKNHASSLIGGSNTLGMTLGAVSGGLIMKIGRRNTLILSCILGIIGCGVTYVENFNVILAGRFIYGFSAGI